MKTKQVTTKTKTAKATVVAAPVTPEPANVTAVVVTPKAKKNAAELATAAAAVIGAKLEAKREGTVAPAPVAAIAEATSKRVTPGAKIEEWRVVRSQRTAQAGFFLQGGHFKMMPTGRNHFIVGYESFHAEKSEAFAALAKQTPAAA